MNNKPSRTDEEAIKNDPCADGCNRGCAHDLAPAKDYTKSAHTPGPWELEIAPFRRFKPKGTNVVNPDGALGKLVGFAVEDRRLIAAAPELLEALKMAEDAMEAALFSVNAAVNSKAVTFASYDNPAVNLKYQINSVRAAIAKAENGAA